MAKAEGKAKSAKGALRDKESIYKFLLDHSKEVILILSRRGKILFANKTILDSFGYSEEEIVGKSITSFLTKDSVKRSLSALAQEFLGHPQPEMEVKARTKSNEIRYLKVGMGSAPVYDKGKLTGVMVCGSDVTALRKTEEELREKEKRFRELWDNAPVAYHTLDTRGIITDVNQTELRMLGYAKEEMLGKSIFGFILPEQRAEAQRRFQQKISGQKISRAEDRTYIRKDGSEIYVSIDDVLERDGRGKAIGVRTTMVDVTEHKLAEEALEESEERFRSVVEHSYEGILIVDDAYRLIYCNDELSRIVGYPHDELVGQDFRKFLDEESRQLVVDHYIRRQRGENTPPRYEFSIVRKDGQKRRVEISSTVFKDSRGKTRTVAELLDITERKIAEEALRKSEEKYRTLTENVNLGIYRNTIGPKGRFLEANPAIVKMFGYESREDFLAVNVSDLYQNPEERKKFNEKMLIQGLVKDEELQLKKKDGTPFIGSISAVAVKDKQGNAEYFDGIIEDITERKRAEKALEESEERYRSLVETSPDAITLVDLKADILMCNRQAARLFGYENESEVIGRHGFDFVAPEDRERAEDGLRMVLENGRDADIEYRIRKKDGTPVVVEVNASLIKNPEGKPMAFLAMIRDITERRVAEKALRESEEKFRNLAEQSPNMIFINKKGRIVYANEKCEEIMGYTRSKLYSPDFNFLDLIGPEFREKIKQYFSKHMNNEDVLPYEYAILTKGGKRIDAILTPKLIDYEGDKAILGIVTDISEQKKAEKIKNSIYRISEAAHSAQNLEELFRSIHNIIGELMPAKNFYIALYDDDRGILSFPYFADEYDEKPAPKNLGKGLTEYVLRTGKALLASPEVFSDLEKRGEVESVGAPSIDWLGVPLKTDNKTFGVLVVQSYTEGVRFKEEDKEILKFVSGQTAMVIKRKRAEEQVRESLREKEVLLQEIHHRVKNNLQIISSLLNLQAGQMRDKDFLKMVKDSQARIRSIALVHEKLYRSQNFSRINFSDYLQSLVIHLFQFNQADSNRIQLKMNLEDVYLDIQTAIPCGLILNELVTNALKHAFPQGRSGEIAVEMHSLEEPTFRITVKDNGVGIPEDLDIGHTTTLGLQIVTMLVKQIEGSLEVQREGGTTVNMTLKKLNYKSAV